MANLADSSRCTGCTACASACPKGCIAMEADENGFLYPKVDETACIHCGRCEAHCPLLAPAPLSMHLPTAYAAYTKDEALRRESSSGGIFTELAKAVLAQGGVVYGAAYDARFRVVHVAVEQEAELSRLRGAKYAQSDLRDSFLQVQKALQQGRTVLFTGTPCQVSGLKTFLQREYETLITMDFVCHSVPSPMAWQSYLRSFGEVQAVSLRAKDTGWSRYRYCHKIVTAQGTRLIPCDESPYMNRFVGGLLSRASCDTCPFKGYRRPSDLTVGDFWGIWNVAPELDDDKGCSLVLCQSERGAQLFQALAPRLMLKQVSLEEASRENPAMLQASRPHPQREATLARMAKGWPQPSLKQRLWRWLRQKRG